MVEKVRPSSVERRPSMTSAAELRDQMLNRRTSSATEAQAMRERNVDAEQPPQDDIGKSKPKISSRPDGGGTCVSGRLSQRIPFSSRWPLPHWRDVDAELLGGARLFF